MKTLAPRAVVVTRKTELEHLVARHGTRAQARFVLESWGRSLESVLLAHEAFERVLTSVSTAIPSGWRVARVDRDELPRFVWDPSDIVLAVGQDGLVANVAKYLDGQPVIGINPDPGRVDGVLVRHPPQAANELLRRVAAGEAELEQRTLVEARLSDGQTLRALNEVFVGHRTHQSSRYTIFADGREERQSSSGVIVATGTGATGWVRSVARATKSGLSLPRADERALCFFVREAFPSVFTGTSIAEGRVEGDAPLRLVSELTQDGVVFGDGLEDDRLRLGWGVEVHVGVADRTLRLA